MIWHVVRMHRVELHTKVGEAWAVCMRRAGSLRGMQLVIGKQATLASMALTLPPPSHDDESPEKMHTLLFKVSATMISPCDETATPCGKHNCRRWQSPCINTESDGKKGHNQSSDWLSKHGMTVSQRQATFSSYLAFRRSEAAYGLQVPSHVRKNLIAFFA